MKNLWIESIRYAGVKNLPGNIVDVCTLDETTTVSLTEHGAIRCFRDSQDQEQLWECDLKELDISPSNQWFLMGIVESNVVCLDKNGAIATLDINTQNLDVVGEFENGIQAAAWSPSLEQLLLVTTMEENTVLLVLETSNWEVLAETEIPRNAVSSEEEDQSISICWRPDGNLCAVSSVDKLDMQRKVRIFKAEDLSNVAIGRTEDGSGKLVPNIQATPIAWAGPGCSQLLTSIQRKGKKTLQVAFFEPNGLRHREFPLREGSECQVQALHWNLECDVLALVVRTDTCDKVQLFHRSNYHWYLKQELTFNDKKVTSLKFSNEDPYEFIVVFSGDSIWEKYRVQWSSSDVLTTQSLSVVYVVDGATIKRTRMHRAIIPPPMQEYELLLTAPVKCIAWMCSDVVLIESILLLSDGRLVAVGGNSETAMIDQAQVIQKKEWDLRHLLGKATNPYRILAIQQSAGKIVLLVLSLDASRTQTRVSEVAISLTDDEATFVQDLHVNTPILFITNWEDDHQGALLELEDGSLYEVNIGGNMSTIVPLNAQPLFEPCPWIKGCRHISTSGGSVESELVIGMTSRGRLYCGELMVANAISSFFVSLAHDYLCFATKGSRCALRFLSLSELAEYDPLMGSDEVQIFEGYEPRAVERGARVICVLPDKPALVLQMPRGNLECIYPRALVLQFVMLKIMNSAYGEAFVLMRRQKVDLNLIIDLNPSKFTQIEHITKFIAEVRNEDALNLFISQLSDVDCTQSRYQVPQWVANTHKEWFHGREHFDFTTKVNTVCESLRGALINAPGDFMLPLLTTYAKESPPKLQDALNLIRDRAQATATSGKKPFLLEDFAQSCIRYLAFLADYEMLYNTALGMYDYELARAVARHSQMDPRIYLPELQTFRELPIFTARYEVDQKLKRYDEALRNLYQARQESEIMAGGQIINRNIDSFTECLRLINENKLYQLGLSLWKDDDNERRAIVIALGDSLPSADALSVYMSIEPIDYERALKAARGCLDWRTYFSIRVDRVEGHDENDRLALGAVAAREFVADMRSFAMGSSRRNEVYCEAARILLDYANDPSGAIDLLIKGEAWSEALRVATRPQVSSKSLALKVREAAAMHSLALEEQLRERVDVFQETFSRYREVLPIRKKAIIESGVDEYQAAAQEHVPDDDASLFSMASVGSVLSTRSSMTTSSTGSASSMSSFVSVRSVSSNTFSITGNDHRHKSKFNQLGQEKKKKKKKQGRKSSKALPGSEAELMNLVDTLEQNIIDATLCKSVKDLIAFLRCHGDKDLTKSLFDTYEETVRSISTCLQDELRSTQELKMEHERKTQRDGHHGDYFVHPLEEKVLALRCSLLDQSFNDWRTFDL